jgi:hypothetical protein
MRFWILAMTIVSLLVSHAEVSGQVKTDEGPIGKIAVTASGVVSFDGAAVTLDGLKSRLADLKKRNGEIWYYREAAGSTPSAQATEVLKLIAESRLPISLSTKPDYSNVILPDGTTRPRALVGSGAACTARSRCP